MAKKKIVKYIIRFVSSYIGVCVLCLFFFSFFFCPILVASDELITRRPSRLSEIFITIVGDHEERGCARERNAGQHDNLNCSRGVRRVQTVAAVIILLCTVWLVGLGSSSVF